MRKDHDLGHKLGPRLVQLVTQATVAARIKVAPIEAHARAAAMKHTIDKAGLEIAELWAPHAHQLLASDDLSPETRLMLQRAASGTHQWQAIAGFALSQSGASASLGSLISNDLAPTVRGIIAQSPGQIPDAATIATLTARNILTLSQGIHNVGEAGFDEFWANAMVALAETALSPDQLFDMLHRGIIGEPELRDLLARFGIAPSQIDMVAGLAPVLLAPADAALAVLRGNMSAADGYAAAHAQGVSHADFDIIIGNTGEPLPLEALLEAKRRGFIDDARLVRGILQSRTRNEWVDVAKQLALSPMSAADAIAAAVQGHISIAEAQTKTFQNGLEPADFQALYQTAGEPLSRTEMEQLFNRGLVDKSEVEQAIRESRTKDKYVDLAFKLHERLPEGRQVVTLITHGALTKAEGIQILLELGYTQKIAAALVASGTAQKLATHHALTLGQIHELYAAAVIDRAKAQSLLAGLTYDAADSAMLLSLWDQLEAAAFTRQAVGVARARFVAHQMNAQQASDYLHQLGLPASAVRKYLDTWALERDATVRQLSESQVVTAVKKSLITQDDGHGRLVAMGYSGPDAFILLGLMPDGSEPGA